MRPNELALRIMAQRKKLGLTQAEAADLVGLKQKTISAIENHPERVRVDTLLRVLSAINLDLQLIDKEDKLKSIKESWKEEW